mmetsp:Transcript_5359/g.13732  ORF Transcript_5359/g.13732 Transcript_5359/m.13732 type:complete len:247 (-) Transcript_5359:530-1270(-)
MRSRRRSPPGAPSLQPMSSTSCRRAASPRQRSRSCCCCCCSRAPTSTSTRRRCRAAPSATARACARTCCSASPSPPSRGPWCCSVSSCCCGLSGCLTWRTRWASLSTCSRWPTSRRSSCPSRRQGTTCTGARCTRTPTRPCSSSTGSFVPKKTVSPLVAACRPRPRFRLSRSSSRAGCASCTTRSSCTPRSLPRRAATRAAPGACGVAARPTRRTSRCAGSQSSARAVQATGSEPTLRRPCSGTTR